MSHHHVREVCVRCGTVLVQCRCIEPKKDVAKGMCKDCFKALTPNSVTSTTPLEKEK